MPRLGGVAFFPAIFVSSALTIVCHNLYMGHDMLDLSLTNRLLATGICLFTLYLLGIMDDLIGVNSRHKFTVQTFCGVVMVLSGLYFSDLHGLFGIHAIPFWIGAPLTVLAVVYMLNAINLIDGIDGLASGLGLIALLAFGYMFIRLEWWMYAFLAAGALGVLLPFFYYNVFGRSRRKLFMGDTGSLTIGLLLAVMAIRLSIPDLSKDTLFPSTIVIAFSFLMVPLLDVARVILYRVRCRKKLFVGDRSHIHHRFMDLGLSQHAAMACIVAIAFVFALVNLWLIHFLNATQLLLLDVALWTAMHCYIGALIRRRCGAEAAMD
ncbi:MAG: undecaprenyl/decaprenyl-phosphate alpha-N-acetylglucosaminyl 1-phosphate transferase [Mediterranea sp.]|nr:undecaprenyl/decaprenyl-phosphate alpha-N-acetylglucosaminyl 1-phosphate transferase [Mediterranea sp.]